MDAVWWLPIAGWLARTGRLTLTRMLLLSLALHAAVSAIVQPRLYPPMAEVSVISARLVNQTDAPVVALPPPPLPATPVVQPAPLLPAPVLAPKPEPAPVVEARPPVQPPAVAPATAKPAPVAEPTSAPTPVAHPKPTNGPDLPSIPVMIDTYWYEARQLDSQPKAIAAIKPEYPPNAVRRGIEGTVRLKLKVDEFGLVRDAEVEEGDPPGIFDESALAAFKNGRFTPARKDGQPVHALIYIRVRYELDKS